MGNDGPIVGGDTPKNRAESPTERMTLSRSFGLFPAPGEHPVLAWRRRAAALMRADPWTTTNATQERGPMIDRDHPTEPSPPMPDEITSPGGHRTPLVSGTLSPDAHESLHYAMSAKLERLRAAIGELRTEVNERLDLILREIQMAEGGQDIVIHEGQLTAQRVTRTECEIAELKSRISRLPCGGRSSADCAAAE